MSNRFTKGKGLFGMIAVGSGGLTLGTSATVKAINYGTLSVIHGTILPSRMGTVATALSGLAAADIVVGDPVTLTTGIGLAGVSPGAGTLTTFLVNPTTGTIAPGTFALTYAQFDLT